MNVLAAKNSLQRAYGLCESDPCLERMHLQQTTGTPSLPKSGLAAALKQGGIKLSPALFLLLVSLLAVGAAVCASPFVNEVFLPIVAAGAASLPFGWLDSKINQKVATFTEDYPTLLLATASSIKAGYTVETALERAVQLMPKTSIVRKEVEALLDRTRKGTSKEKSISQFAACIKLPDIELFRAAYLLATENGGRFTPTLERLARVTRDRVALINAARVSTSTMRMTSNILLVLTPLILGVVSLRSETFWSTLIEDPTANTAAAIGLTAIGAGYFWVRCLSAFKP